MRRRLLLVIIYMCVAVASSGRECNFARISLEQGISQSDITDITQDSSGFIWFATNNGLNRYDGYNIHSYKVKDGVVDNVISSLACDALSNIWVGTINGICAYNTLSSLFTTFELEFPAEDNLGVSKAIRSMCVDKESTIYITTNRRIFSKSRDEDNFRFIKLSQNIGAINRIMPLSNSRRLIVATNMGLYMLNAQTGVVESLLQKQITAIGQSRTSSDIYIATQQSLMIFDVVNYSCRELTYNGKSIEKVVDILHDSSDRIWVGTQSHGVYLFEDEKVEHIEMLYVSDSSLSSNYILSLFEDSSSTIWIGTSNGGVNRYQEPTPLFSTIRHNVVNPNKGLSDNVVQAIHSENDSIVWIGTKGGYLNRWNRNQDTFEHYKSPFANKINALMPSSDGRNIWIGCSDGLYIFNKKGESFERWESDNNQHRTYVNALFLDYDSTLWCASGKGIFAICSDGEVVTMPSVNSSNGEPNTCRVIYRKDPTSPLYAGFKHHGLHRIELQRNSQNQLSIESSPILPDTLLSVQDVSTIYQDNEDVIYFGTWGNGVKCWDGESLRSYTEEDGLSDNIVFSIYEDREGSLWMSTYNGLSLLDPVENTFRNFSYYYGIQSNEFSVGAHAQNHNGEIILGGINGITHFTPLLPRDENKRYPLALSDLYIYNERVESNVPIDQNIILSNSLNSSDQITLPYKFNTFTISLSLISYANPYRNQFSYRLKGYDDRWRQQTGNPYAVFSKIPPGEYIFEALGAVYDGSWNIEPRSLKIKIRPPFYRSNIAILIYLLLTIGSIVLFVRYMQFRLRLQKQRIAEHSQQELYDARMKFYTNISHDLRTPLTLILGLIEKFGELKLDSANSNRLTIMKRNADLLLRLINDIIDVRKIETGNVTITQERCNIQLFVGNILSNFEEDARSKEIKMSLHSPNVIHSLIDADKCEKILYNLLSNAMKFTKDLIEVEIAIISTNDECIDEPEWFDISIRDNGAGIPAENQERIFQRFFRSENHRKQGSGIGLNVAFELAQLMGGSLRVESQMGLGATFTLRIPLVVDFDKEFDHQGVVESTEAKGKAGLILIIDDNADLRFLLRDTLQDKYEIHEADSGEVGLEMIQQLVPDLIICDIMMPGISGIEVCHQVKTNKDSALIPFILISARTSDTYKVEGLSYGADAYFTKPFSTSHIKAQIDSILTNRNTIKRQMSIDLITKPQDVENISRENKWLNRMVELIEKNIEDPDYDIERMSVDMAVSRMQLYRNFKSLLGQTPSDFVRNFKLTRAADLLTSSDLSISEVCYAIGYNNPKYFRNVFIKRYNISPSQYREAHCKNKHDEGVEM